MLYKPTLSSSKTTEVVLNVQTSEPNNLMFYLARKKVRKAQVWEMLDLSSSYEICVQSSGKKRFKRNDVTIFRKTIWR